MADCFEYRGRIGTDVAPEALRLWVARRRRRGRIVDQLTAYACIDRAGRVIHPYLEAIL